MKIYTKTGDDGTTGLVGGGRVRKADARIDSYGTVDELNAAVGFAAVQAEGPLLEDLRRIQADLFVIGSHLATPAGSPHRAALPPLGDEMVSLLERSIDATTEKLPPLAHFILPGGSELAARLHLARTICRRAERLVVGLPDDCAVPGVVVTYLNRLSDWLFVEARAANFAEGVEDVIWKGKA